MELFRGSRHLNSSSLYGKPAKLNAAVVDSIWGNLQSLKRVKAAWFLSGGTSEERVAEAKAAVIHEVKIHPNRPSLRIR